MSIHLSPSGVAIFFLLGLGVLCHPCSGFLHYNRLGHFSLYGLGGGPEAGEVKVAFTSKHSFNILLRLLWY
jgi:inositol monophosphatase 3